MATPAHSQGHVERRLSALSLHGTALPSNSNLGGWGTFSASSQLTVAELDSILEQIRKMKGALIDEALETHLRNLMLKLSKVLSDAEVCHRFTNQRGLDGINFALATLKGDALQSAISALRTFATHEFALDQIVQSFPVQTQLWSCIRNNINSSPIIKQVLTLLSEVVSRNSNGFGFVLSLHFQNANGFFPMLVTCLRKESGLDVQIAVIKLVNALLAAAKDNKQFTAVFDELSSGGNANAGNAVAASSNVSFQQALSALQSDPSPALKEEISLFRAHEKNGFKSGANSEASKKEIATLKKQLADISALATEYRSTCSRLENELKNFKRREPLVQLLWTEIQQLRGALNVAISAGFAYDLSDPSSRYVKPSHFAYIDKLDVSRWAGGAAAPSLAQADSDITGIGMGPGLGMGSSSRGGAPVTKAPTKQVAGMRSGDDPDQQFQSQYISPLSGPMSNAGNVVMYDIPPPPPDEDAPPPPAADLPPGLFDSTPAAGSAVDASSSTAATTTTPSASTTISSPDAPAAPFVSAPAAPGAPSAPPMAPGAPGAPGAPPMAPGAPVMGPGIPRAPAGPQPTKPVIKPLRKMKALHWTRILVPVGNDKSIWTKVNQKLPTLESKVPVKELDELFADVRKEKAEEKEGSAAASAAASGAVSPRSAAAGKKGGASNENVRILNDKRFNAVAIMLSFLPQPNLVVQAIKKLDGNALDKDQVAALHKQMPTEEEMSAIVNSGHTVTELAKPEGFLFQLASSIPCVNSRIDCWHFSNSFKECMEDLRTPFTFIEAAIDAILQSKCLPQLCAVVLQAGNYINGGTNRGQADGFDLGVLARLSMIKDVQGNNMLSYVVNKLLDTDGMTFGDNFVKELSACRAAAEFPLRPALVASTRFQGLIKTQKNLAALVIAGTDDSMDPFNAYMDSFGRESESAGLELKTLGQRTNDSFNVLLFYLNPAMDAANAAKMNSEELFQTLVDFGDAVKQCTDARKAAAEAEIQAKKNAEIRERQAAAKAKAAAEKAEKAAAAAAASK